MAARQMLSIRQVAWRAQVSVQTAYAWVRSGDLRAVRLGRVWRIDPQDLVQFLAGETGEGEAE